MMSSSEDSAWFVLGYGEPAEKLRTKFNLTKPNVPVDNFFRLQPEYGFEQVPQFLTLGIRGSRFASILVWEAFHALAKGGLWLDVDYRDRIGPTDLCPQDHFERGYYDGRFELLEDRTVSRYRLRLFRKTRESLLSSSILDNGWTFGILTASPSINAERMVREILDLNLSAIEVVICGPASAGLPRDARVRQIDLENPEPRGWITRKKNMIVDNARHENLCIMHDRFFVPGHFAEAMTRYGNLFSVLTFPQVYFADRTGECIQRYPDYQVLQWDGPMRKPARAGIFDGHYVFHPQYSDFHETAFCCGGLYVTKKSLWNLVRQNEALYHAEWEDAVFGYECQRMGIPHRVNPYSCVESTNSHPMLLTSIHLLHPTGRRERAFRHLSEHQQRLAERNPGAFHPLLAQTKRTYCAKLVKTFNATQMANRVGHLTEADFNDCGRLSEIWSVVYERVADVAPRTRAEAFDVFALISTMIFNHSASVLQNWTRDLESALAGMSVRPRFSFRQLLHDALTFPAKVILKKIWEAKGASRAQYYRPLAAVISYFEDVERQYPVAFASDADLNQPRMATKPNRDTLLTSPQNFRTIFFQHREGLLPPIDGPDDSSHALGS